jgi:pilus assembly protein CpaB
VGTLSLALRNQVDPQSAATSGATKVTLLPEAAPPPPPKPAPKPVVVTRPVPVVVKTAARVERNCVTVLNGLRSAQECF